MSSVCDDEQVLAGDDAQLDFENEYLKLARLLSDKEVCCFFFSFDFVCNGVALF